MNTHIRNQLIKNIRAAIEEAQIASNIGHRFLKGRIREITLDNLIKPVINVRLQIGTGKIIDSNNVESSEVDLIVHSKELIPPLMYSDRLGLFPAESCLAAIEVKSTINATELQSSIRNAQQLASAGVTYLSGEMNHSTGISIPHSLTEIAPSFFAFNTDITEEGLDEFERYKNYDENWETDPAIHAICVVGRGSWFYNTLGDGNSTWMFVAPTADYEEVIAFLRVLSDSCVLSFAQRKAPLIGEYLIPRSAFTKL